MSGPPAHKIKSYHCQQKCFYKTDNWEPCGGICQLSRDEYIWNRMERERVSKELIWKHWCEPEADRIWRLWVTK